MLIAAVILIAVLLVLILLTLGKIGVAIDASQANLSTLVEIEKAEQAVRQRRAALLSSGEGRELLRERLRQRLGETHGPQ